MTTPAKTASAKLCKNTVIKETSTITITSCVGIFPNDLRLVHSKVPIATMIIKPVNAAIGNCSMIGAPNMMNVSSINEATIPDNLALAPEEILISD